MARPAPRPLHRSAAPHARARRSRGCGSARPSSGLGGQLTIVAVMLHVYDLTAGHLRRRDDRRRRARADDRRGSVRRDARGRLRPARSSPCIAATVTFAVDGAARGPRLGAARDGLVALRPERRQLGGELDRHGHAQAIVPRLLPRELLARGLRAAAASRSGIMVMAGPALAGVLVAFTGYAWTYTIDVDAHAVAVPRALDAAAHPPGGRDRAPGARVAARRLAVPAGARRNIRLQFILDIIAMTFGQPLALFPAIGAVLLGGGPITTGVLTAAVRGRRVPLEPVLRPDRAGCATTDSASNARSRSYGASIAGVRARAARRRARRVRRRDGGCDSRERRAHRRRRRSPWSSRAPPTTSARSTATR